MREDPDFHNTAAAWLDGTGDEGSRRLLREILRDAPGAAAEFAALARAEAALQLAGLTQAQRLERSRRLIQPSFANKLPRFIAHPVLRWGIAAGLMAGLAIWLLRTGNETENTSAKRRIIAPTDSQPGSIRSAPGSQAKPAPDPEAAALEKLLRRWYVSSDWSGPLPEVADRFLISVSQNSGHAVAADVQHAGDAPVHLRISCALPAWTMLQMMALQTGTSVELSGSKVVFRRAERPAAPKGTLACNTSLAACRMLLTSGKPHSGIEYALFSVLTSEGFGSDINFNAKEGESAITCSGAPRDVRVLETALAAVADPPIRIELATTLVRVPPGIEVGIEGEQPADTAKARLRGIFTTEQFNAVKRTLEKTDGVDILSFGPMLAAPADDAEFDHRMDGQTLTVKLAAFPDGQTVDLNANIALNSAASGDHVPGDPQKVNTQVLLWTEQTLGASGFWGKDGSEYMVFITAKLIDGAEAGAQPSASKEALEQDIARMQTHLEILLKLHGEEVIRLPIELGLDNPTIQKVYPEYQAALASLQSLQLSGFGPRHPKIMALKASTQSQFGQLMEAVEAYKASLKANLEHAKEMLAAAKDGADRKTEEERPADTASPPLADLPYGIPVVGRAGFSYSPYVEGTSKLVDISGLKRGTRIRCPFTGKDFRVP